MFACLLVFAFTQRHTHFGIVLLEYLVGPSINPCCCCILLLVENRFRAWEYPNKGFLWLMNGWKWLKRCRQIDVHTRMDGRREGIFSAKRKFGNTEGDGEKKIFRLICAQRLIRPPLFPFVRHFFGWMEWIDGWVRMDEWLDCCLPFPSFRPSILVSNRQRSFFGLAHSFIHSFNPNPFNSTTNARYEYWCCRPDSPVVFYIIHNR